MAFGTQPDDAANIPISAVYSKENNSFPALQAEPGTYKDSNSNQSSAAIMSFLRPLIVQKAHAVTGAGAKTLNCAFTSNNIAGNSIIVALGMGEVDNGSTITLAVTDSAGNSYTRATSASQSTTLEAAIFYTTNIPAGANTVTITVAGGSSVNTAIGVEIYEVWGVVAPGALDQTATGNNAGSTTPATGAIAPVVPNELAIAAISAGGNTITAGSGWTLDSTSLSPLGGNLVSFGVESQSLTTIAALTPQASLSGSTSWAIAAATFKSVIVPVSGTVSHSPTTSGGTSDFHLISAASTNATSIKASAGQVYGYDIGNNGASDAYVKLYNTAGTPTAGAGTPFRTIYIPKGSRASFHSTTGLAMGTGIGLTITGGAADNDATAVGAAQVIVEIDYK